ncbi:GmrSD restriction endonuclease domain-containing protein [Ruminococcus sp.]
MLLYGKKVGDNYDMVYEAYLHTLGNLTITGYNSELGTKSFNEKKKLYVIILKLIY